MVDYQSFREYVNGPFIIVVDQVRQKGVGVSYAKSRHGNFQIHKRSIDLTTGTLLMLPIGNRFEASVVAELRAKSSGTARSLIDRQLVGVERTMRISTQVMHGDMVELFSPLQDQHCLHIKVWQSNGVFGLLHDVKVVVPEHDISADIAKYTFLPCFVSALVRCEPFEPQENQLLHNWQIDYKAEKLSE